MGDFSVAVLRRFLRFFFLRSMQGRAIAFTIYVTAFAVVLLSFVSSSAEHVKNAGRATSKMNNSHKLSPRLEFDITLHGFLLWASMGFLMPAGILAIRMSQIEECGRRLRNLFYVHSILQMFAVLLATAGAVVSIKNFNNSFNNHHQRLGVALYGMVWLQALIGFIRPHRGSKRRSVWFSIHWVLGTAVSLLSVINTYTGIQAYNRKTLRSIKLWTIIFTVEVSIIVFIYLLQDKWVYIQKQGVILGNEPIKSPNQVISSPEKQKDLTTDSRSEV